ncbi:outer membrane protein transport protein [Nibrella saemangeumensis]|uniref:Outer membrane protein transport protein n=1 Tax=Nibrella saemangeumensis TaxID=1084526 RepID=A0ABP8NGZ5_9BACT
MNRSIWITGGLLLTATVSYGQYASDAFRYSEQTINGTARFQGLGGNHTALGGDASAAFGNPAGLGFYNRSEFSISPALRLVNVDGSYAGTTTNAQKAFPTIGQAALVFAGSPQSDSRAWRRTSFAVTYSRQVNLNNIFTYQGRNLRSSLADAYVQDVNRRNISSANLDREFDPQTNTANNIEAAAYQLYLVNPTDPSGNGTQYVRYDVGVPTEQRGSYTARGGQSQWTIAYAGNLEDRLYLGASLGLTRTRFDFTNVLDDQYIGGRVFRGFSESSDLTVTGGGINASFGAIFKPDQNFQIGVALTSPTFSSLREEYNRSITIDPIGIPVENNQLFVPDVKTVEVAPNNFEYSITSPLRASGGATYFLGRSGFLTATAEYVGYSGMRIGTNFYQAAADNQAFREDNKREVQNTYQSVVNFRVGGEARINLFRVRAGVAYLPDPYKVKIDNLDRTKFLFSGGFGVRNDRFFADVAGSYLMFKSAYTPYTLSSPQDFASAQLTNRNTNLMLTVGVFF